MKDDRSPLFRKTISPWYDTEASCIAVIILMVVVLLFSLCGIWVARSDPEYGSHLWLPLGLTVMCLYVIVSTTVRLIRRKFSHRGDRL